MKTRSILLWIALVCSGLSQAWAVPPARVATSPYRESMAGSGNSYAPVLSADGQHVAFVSHANNLVTNDDLGPYLDLFVRDLSASNIVLVSVSSNGVGGANDNIALYSLSSNAQLVAFETAASNLVPGDTNRASDIYVRNMTGGATVLVSVNAAGTGSANGPSTNPLISEDGRFVVFESLASNIVTNDFNGTNDIFIRDLVTGTTALVSVNSEGAASPAGPSYSPSISANGLLVAFVSRANNLVVGVTNRAGEIYVRDVVAGSNLWAMAAHLSAAHSRSPASGALETYSASEPILSADGRYVAFKTLGQTVRFDLQRPTNLVVVAFTNNSPPNPSLNYFRFDDNPRLSVSAGAGPLAFTPDGRFLAYGTRTNVVPYPGIARVDFESFQTNVVYFPPEGTSGGGSFATNQVPAGGLVVTNFNSPNGQPSWVAISTNGGRVFFLSDSKSLVPEASNQTFQVFSLDVDIGTLRLLSTNRAGAAGPDLGGVVPDISADGGTIAWDSPDAGIVANDLNRSWDVFVRRVDSGEVLLASIRDPAFPATTAFALSQIEQGFLSANGGRVAFVSTDSSLVPDDTNNWPDLFVRSLANGTTVVASYPNPPLPGGGAAAGPALSADGRFVAFAIESVSFVGTNRAIYWRDLQAPTNRLIVAGNGANNLAGNSVSRPVLSADGRLLAFHSADVHDTYYPDGNGQFDVFVRRLSLGPPFDCTPAPWLFAPYFVSTAGPDNATASGASVNPAFSPDSSMVLFQSLATNLMVNPISAPSRYQLYGRSVWVTNRLDGTCARPWEVLAYGPTRLISYTTSRSPDPDGKSLELPLPGGGGNPHFSGDSRFVAFEENPNLIHLHDLLGDFVSTVIEQDGVRHTNQARLTNVLVCSSCASPTLSGDGRFVAYETRPTTGATNIMVKNLATGQSELISVNQPGNGGGNRSSSTPLISYDARFVVFASKASDLVPNDNNNATDIFVRDRLNGVTHCLSRNRGGTGTGNRVSSHPILSADGRTVAFQSFASDLVAGDYNDTRDVFVVTLSGPDSDGDGMDDDWEMAYFNTLGRNGTGDFDGDGASDLAEFHAGTNPSRDASVLRVITLVTLGDSPLTGQRTTTIIWSAVPGRSYRVQFKDTVDAPWNDLPGTVMALSPSASTAHTAGDTGSPRFYRVILAQ